MLSFISSLDHGASSQQQNSNKDSTLVALGICFLETVSVQLTSTETPVCIFIAQPAAVNLQPQDCDEADKPI